MSGFNAKRIGNTLQSNYVIGLGRNRSAIASISREYNYLARTSQTPFCSLFDFNCSSIPSAPIITSTTPFSTSIEINFTQPSNGGSAILNYQYSLNSGSSWTSFSPSVTTSPASITGLTPGQTYSITIRAVNAIGTSNASNTVTQTTLAIAPSAPIITSTTPFSTSIEINFTESSDGGSAILNYEYSLNSGSSWTPFSPSVTTSPASITGLTSGQTYNITIRAVNVIGPSNASNSVSQRTLSVPEAPTDLSAIPGDTSIEITFTEPYDGGSPITNYEYSLNDGTSWSPFSPSVTTSPVTINSLTNGTVYNIKLRAINAIGEGTASSQINIAPIPSNSFDPADISGINLWLDGQYPSSVVISDNNVTAWDDKSGANNDFASGPSGTITYSQPSGINSRPAIYFETAPSTYLSRSFNIAPSTNQLSLFMVVYHVSNVTGNSELFYSQTGPTSPGYAYFDLFNNTNNPSGLLSINIGSQTQVSTGINIRGTIALIDVIATTTADVYVNGTQTNNNITRGPLSLDNVIGWAISNGAFQGYVGEIVTYPSGLSDSDRQKVEGYLAWKWGLQANLPNSQPYKNAPPISLDAPVITVITGASQALSVVFTQVTGGLTITNYQYSTDNGATFTALATPDITSPLTITTLSSDGTTLLTNGVTYDVIIQAKTANGLGSLSNMVQGTPTLPGPPAPTALSSVAGNTQAYILFTQSGTVTNYEYSTDDGATFLAFNPPQIYSPVNITTISSDGLTPLTNGTTYTVKLKAVNSGASSSESVAVDVVPTVTSLTTSGRIIYLDANNSSSYPGSGTAWTNLDSGGAYSATLQNSPIFDNTNKWFTFDGINQIANISAAAGINPTTPFSPFTIQIWARVNTASPNFNSGDGLISKQFGASSYDGYSLSLNTSGAVVLNMNGGSVNGNYGSSAGVYSNGWALYTIVVRFGGGSGNPSYAYVSTRRVVTANNAETSMPSPGAALQFPRGIQETNANFCPADVGAFYLYNTALSQETIIQNFDASKSRYI